MIETIQQMRNILVDEFGYRNVRIIGEGDSPDTRKADNVNIISIDDVEDKSELFGTPIFMPLQFERVKYKDGNTTRIIPQFMIPACIVEISFQKTIVKTQVQSQKRRGDVMEHINFGNYAVSIKGILSDDSGKYPMQKTKWLNDLCLAPIEVEVVHRLLNEIGIYQLVIESGGIIPRQGYQDIQPFQLQCVEHIPIKLIEKAEA
jgi:hypothetical protein